MIFTVGPRRSGIEYNQRHHHLMLWTLWGSLCIWSIILTEAYDCVLQDSEYCSGRLSSGDENLESARICRHQTRQPQVYLLWKEWSVLNLWGILSLCPSYYFIYFMSWYWKKYRINWTRNNYCKKLELLESLSFFNCRLHYKLQYYICFK